ncbi:MAG: hypothetical protein LIO86_00135 [Lachnospiraceae bacterium]|nr:hypothetical protein [Lachnospiraceae bacterium]
MIYFYDDVCAKTVETIKSACDCEHILNDLRRIEQAERNIQLYGDLLTAHQLDLELRQKYPCINNMLDLANSINTSDTQTQGNCSKNEAIKTHLDQDYFGILCDTAIKKQIISSIKEFIKRVD